MNAKTLACLEDENPADWKARHAAAMTNPRTLFEKALVEMLGGWKRYAEAHQTAYGSGILEDGVLGESWFAIAEGLLGLLNGELGRLDGGTLDKTIRSFVESPELAGQRKSSGENDSRSGDWVMSRIEAVSLLLGDLDSLLKNSLRKAFPADSNRAKAKKKPEKEDI